MFPELQRLAEDAKREKNWKRWGPYLSDRQWATVREDYSAKGDSWNFFPHDHARSRAYRWGEDGLLGFTDRECRLCFSVALWNGRDPFLKERLFGLTGKEGNHGEDVKECYFYLDALPTYRYAKALYKYPQGEFPYARLLEENKRRGRELPEFELADTGIFDENRYFDVYAEYAKAAPNDILIKLTAVNRGPEQATLHLLPTLWFRNTWTWGCLHEGCWIKPRMWLEEPGLIANVHATLEKFYCTIGAAPDGKMPDIVFTENESNTERLWNAPNSRPYVKDSFHDYVIHGKKDVVNPAHKGTKASAIYVLEISAGGEQVIHLRLYSEADKPAEPLGAEFESVFEQRRAEADAFYAERLPKGLGEEETRVARQAYAGLLWTKQFYNYIVKDWLSGDPNFPPPPASRPKGRNHEWTHVFNRDVISMPDKWEYPWYAAWDHAFHMLPFARIDPDFAKAQMVLFLREWYMHPNGQLPAYEFNFSDVNPPVHAWVCWQLYKMTDGAAGPDRHFLARVFPKLLINFTWWVNRKDPEGRNLFSGGFLGLDNIGVLDRSKPLPGGARLEQADATAWMAFYCATMLAMALELARDNPAYEDVASKFFEHFVAIADAMNGLGGSGLWDEADGFYYDQLLLDGKPVPMRIRSLVGLIPLFALEMLEADLVHRLSGFRKRMMWFIDNRKDLQEHISYMERRHTNGCESFLLAIPSRNRLRRVLRYALDEKEFLSPFGLRSLSRIHLNNPFHFSIDGDTYSIEYEPGEAKSDLFGGNSNWRGPVWFPINYLFIVSLERYHAFFGDSFKVECPTGSGHHMNLKEVADFLAERLVRLFLPDENGRRPAHGDCDKYAHDPAWRDLILFYEYFHGETGQGLGASHQTGWTALVTLCLERIGENRTTS